MLNFDKRNIILNLFAEDSDSAINQIVDLMKENGYVKEKYYWDVIEREKVFPTGLPTEGVKIAMPHANSEAVILSGVAVALLEKPVVFKNMANPDEEIDVEIIFLLANADSSQQVKDIQALMGCFSDADTLNSIRKASGEDEILKILKNLQ